MLKSILCFSAFILISSGLEAIEDFKCDSKVLICGVCRNIETHLQKNIENIETLGSRFVDYQVILYENNSVDNTSLLISEWAAQNEHVIFLSENLLPNGLPRSRTERIARARNIVLSVARDPKFADFEYLVMADLDSANDWPFDEVIATVHSENEWDCVSANDLYLVGWYRDRYSFRDDRFPLGPELIGDTWWWELARSWFKITGEDWVPVYSAFGGFAIYKTKSILPFSYSGVVTEDLRAYYEKILTTVPRAHFHRIMYLSVLEKGEKKGVRDLPVIFRKNTSPERDKNHDSVTVCEHVTLHAAMAVNGHGKFFINPKMKVAFN